MRLLDEGRQADKQAGKQASKQASKQAGRSDNRNGRYLYHLPSIYPHVCIYNTTFTEYVNLMRPYVKYGRRHDTSLSKKPTPVFVAVLLALPLSSQLTGVKDEGRPMVCR